MPAGNRCDNGNSYSFIGIFHLTGDQEVAGSIPNGYGNGLSWILIMEFSMAVLLPSAD